MNKQVREAVRRNTSRWRPLALASGRFVDCFLFFLVLGGCAFGIHVLWSTALADARFRMNGETLSLAGAIRECPESVAAFERLGREFNGRSLLDPGLVGDMEKAYRGNVWVKEITGLRRRFPNRVEVEFLLRLPSAQVWHEGAYWMVDMDGVVLPVDGVKKRFANLPEIVGVTPNVIGKRPRAGEPWDDEGVLGALGIMRALWGSPLAEVLPVERVVVNMGALGDRSRLASPRRRFEVVTGQGAVVRWGTFNSGEMPGELGSSEKLYHLQELLRRKESLKPGVSFDVRTRLPGYFVTQ
jgi:hypothetical protein